MKSRTPPALTNKRNISVSDKLKIKKTTINMTLAIAYLLHWCGCGMHQEISCYRSSIHECLVTVEQEFRKEGNVQKEK